MTQIDEKALNDAVKAIASEANKDELPDGGWHAYNEACARAAITAYLASAKPAGDAGAIIERLRQFETAARNLVERGERTYLMHRDEIDRHIEVFCNAATALEALTRQGDAEPRAWLVEMSEGQDCLYYSAKSAEESAARYNTVVQRLYTHPPATGDVEKLREALEKIACRTQTENLLWWQQEARAALASVSPSPSVSNPAEGDTQPGLTRMSELQAGICERKLAWAHKAVAKSQARITELEAQLSALREGKGEEGARSKAMEAILDEQLRRPRLSPSPTAPGEKE